MVGVVVVTYVYVGHGGAWCGWEACDIGVGEVRRGGG